jgi:hypothetical protein
VFDHRTAVDLRKRLSGKTRRLIPSRDDGDDSSSSDGRCQL